LHWISLKNLSKETKVTYQTILTGGIH